MTFAPRPVVLLAPMLLAGLAVWLATPAALRASAGGARDSAPVPERRDSARLPPRVALVRRTAESTVDSTRRVATFSAVVANRSADTVTLVPVAILPAGWRVITGAAPVVIAPGAEQAWIATVAVREASRAGSYPVHFAFHSETRGAPGTIRGAPVLVDSARVIVMPRHEFQLQLNTPPPVGRVGEPLRLEARLVNRGNTAAVAHLAATARYVLPNAAPIPATVHLETAVARVEPGQTRTVLVVVTESRAIAPPASVALDLVAEVVSGNRTLPPLDVSTRVPLVQLGGSDAATWAWLPLRARFRMGGGGLVSPIEISGKVPLSTLGTSSFAELFASGPRVSPLGERSEYRLRLHTATAELVAGDHRVSLTPLHEPGRVLSGASGELRLGSVTLSGTGSHDRWSSTSTTLRGAMARYAPSPAVALAVTGSERRGGDAGRLVSASGSFRPAAGVAVEVESAVGRARSGAENGWAHLARATLERGRVSAELRDEGGDDRVPGPQRGVGATLAALRLRATHSLHFEGEVTRDRLNGGVLHLSTFTTAADAPEIFLPVERRTTGEVGARLHERFGIELASATRVGSLGSLHYDGRERTVRVRADLHARRSSFSALVEGGAVLDHLADENRPLVHIAVNGSMRAGSRVALSTFGDVRRGSTAWSSPSLAVSGGVDAGVSVSSSLRLRVNAYQSKQHSLFNGLIPVPSAIRYRRLDVAAERGIGPDGMLTVRARRAWTRSALLGALEPGGSQMVLEYGGPLRIPLWRASGRGRVLRFVDAETGDGIPDVLARFRDEVAMSDERGEVRFAGVPSGAHRVELLASAATAGRVVTDPRALAIAASEGGKPAARVPLARAGWVRGRVQAEAIAEAASGTAISTGVAYVGEDSLGGAAVGVPEAVVTLASGRDTVRVVTGESGDFDVSGLRPGTWVVGVAGGRLPRGFEYAARVATVAVAGGESARIVFRATVRPRAVKPLRVAVANVTHEAEKRE